MNRKTSVYTIRCETAGAAEAAATGLHMAARIIDRGELSVSFRSSGDTLALQTAQDAMAGLDDPWTLSTGLGIHRREVQPA